MSVSHSQPDAAEQILPTPVDASVATQPMVEDGQPHRWSLGKRIAFRLAFCYLGGYCIFSNNVTIWSVVPSLGTSKGTLILSRAVARAFLMPAQYLAGHLFHVAPPGDRLHGTGSGDTAINWIVLLLLLAVSVIATAVWSVLDRRRPHYQTLEAWLRFLIRLTLGLGMVVYGLDKVFPLQMAPPSVSSLAEPLGMHSPMAVLWDFIGVNPLYEMVCGWAEFLAGVMLLFRRTALAGAIFSVFVIANVVLYNFFFDVPVKIYSAHLLLLALFVILPDAKALFRFFWKHEPAAPTGVWVPQPKRRWFRRATLVVEVVFVALAVGESAFGSALYWVRHHKERVAAIGCEMCRAWRVEEEPPAGDMARLPSPFGTYVAEVAINTPTQAVLSNDSEQGPIDVPVKIDDVHHTIEFDGPGKNKTVFAIAQTDATEMTLAPTGDKAGKAATLKLTSLTPKSGYLLTHRGFHWVSEYPYVR